MLCMPVFIFTSSSSALRAPTLWLIHLTSTTCHIQYTPSEFMPIPWKGKQTKPENTWSRPFSYHRALILRAPVTFLSQRWPALTLRSTHELWKILHVELKIFNHWKVHLREVIKYELQFLGHIPHTPPFSCSPNLPCFLIKQSQYLHWPGVAVPSPMFSLEQMCPG